MNGDYWEFCMDHFIRYDIVSEIEFIKKRTDAEYAYERELDDKDKEMRNIHKTAQDKVLLCNNKYPLVQNLVTRIQQTEANWRKTKYALLGTMTSNAEFEKN